MRLPMKFGVSLAVTTALPSRRSTNCSTAAIAIGVSFRRGNYFQQTHVARRVEKVSAEPMFFEARIHPFGNLRDGQSAGVGGDDRVGAAKLVHFCQKARV